uniref:Uncharacterized protein n=1 Tax=Mustela putorius furo TaxID=9669 RepID=M3Y9U6_MUSPF
MCSMKGPRSDSRPPKLFSWNDPKPYSGIPHRPSSWCRVWLHVRLASLCIRGSTRAAGLIRSLRGRASRKTTTGGPCPDATPAPSGGWGQRSSQSSSRTQGSTWK